MEVIVLIALFLGALWISTAKRIKRANEEIEAEMGDDYKPDRAGKPWRDGLLIVLAAAVATLVLAAAVVPSV